MRTVLKTSFVKCFIICVCAAIFVTAGVSAQTEELPAGYKDIRLGMELETVKEVLLKSPEFIYRGPPDITMLPVDKEVLIDCEGSYYIDRAFFQFEDNKLYLIILVLNSERVDHYSMYTALEKKYGKPEVFNPSAAQWLNNKVILSLERPLSVKYIDREVFESLKSDNQELRSYSRELRQNFIDSF